MGDAGVDCLSESLGLQYPDRRWDGSRKVLNATSQSLDFDLWLGRGWGGGALRRDILRSQKKMEQASKCICRHRLSPSKTERVQAQSTAQVDRGFSCFAEVTSPIRKELPR